MFGKFNLVRLGGLFVLVGVMTSLIGCGDGDTPNAAISKANKTNSQRLANLYLMHQMKNKFQGPKDEAAFKAFIQQAGDEVLEPMGVDPNSVDELFVSERDGQPFVIRYGVTGGPRGSTEAVIFEQTGEGGKRMVGFLNMVQREVDASEYDQLLSAKAPAKQANTARGDMPNRGK